MKDCTQCGKCCINYGNGGLSATRSEIEGWENDRPDIFAYVRDGKIWMDPATGRQLLFVVGVAALLARIRHLHSQSIDVLLRAAPYAIGGVAAFWTIERLVNSFSPVA